MSFIFKATITTAASVFDTPPDYLSCGGETKSFTAGASTDASPPATSTSTFGSNKPLSFRGFTSPPVQTVGSPGFGSPQTTTTTEKPVVTGITTSSLGVTTSGLGISTSTITSGIVLTGGLLFAKTIAATTSTTTPSGITALRKSTGVMTTTAARDVTPAATPDLASPVKPQKGSGPSNATPELVSPVKAREIAEPSNATLELASPVKGRKRAGPSNAPPELTTPVKGRKRAEPSNVPPEQTTSVKSRKKAGPSNATPELAAPVKARKRAGPSNATLELASPVKVRKGAGPTNATLELESPVKARKGAGPFNATPELASPVKARKGAGPSNATLELASPVKARKGAGPSNATPELASPVNAPKRAGPSNATPELASPVKARKGARPSNATLELASPVKGRQRAGPSNAPPELTTPVKGRKRAEPSNAPPEQTTPVKARKGAGPSNATLELASPVKARKGAGPSNATPKLASPVNTPKRAGPSNATPELASPVKARKTAAPSNATPELASPVKAPKQAGPSNATPELVSPVKARKGAKTSKGQPNHSKKSRRSPYRTDTDIFNILNDSGSDGEEDNNYFSNSEDDAEGDNLTEDNVCMVRNFSKKMRNKIMDSEDEEVEEGTEADQDESVMNERSDGVNEASERSTAAASVDTNFSWSKDFSSFAGQKEVYLRVPGPNFSSQDPVNIFLAIWDQEFMETIVRETNLYAWQTIAQQSDPDLGTGIPPYLDGWIDVTVAELYRYFAILIFFSFCYRTSVHEYWSTGILGMSVFRQIMSRNRFLLIHKFLHFVSNDNLSMSGHDGKIEKVAPVMDHCNRKFAALYTPSQYLSLDESLLLWKGRLSWKQCIRSKAARFGIKTFELCEAVTGYLLQFRLYTGKRVEMHSDAIHGFQDHTSKIVLDLMGGYLDVGHVLVMDNWYNQLPLTRYLKSRHTDVLGTIKRQRQGVPPAISSLDPNAMKRGKSVGRHSGDMTLVAWKDVKLVTIISTYHKHLMVSARRAGEEFKRPIAVEDYNRYMGGVDLKDQKLSMFLMERKRGLKWYMKVFKRLFNTSLLNAYIIYSRSPMHQMLSHREFRFKVAEGLLSRYPLEFSGPSTGPVTEMLFRLQPGNHFPVYTGRVSGHRNEKKRLRCVRCYAVNQRVTVRTLCELCEVPLCLGKCWKEYHTVLKFTK